MPDFKCAPARDLPVVEGGAWDGGAAAGRMLDAAGIGGDNPDPASAQRGFLIVDGSATSLRGSYHLPFADMIGGRLTAVGSGLDAAAQRLPQMDGLSDTLRASAQSVIDGYKSRLNDMKNAAPKPQTRAYSVLTIRAVDEEQRIIEGIASTPSTDRYGDVVEPMGAQFSLPMPLLWMHNTDQPVGLVEVANATKDGITFRAQLPRILDAGTLRDRVDEAWQTVKAGLVRGVSIGFKPLTWDLLENGAGLRYSTWDWLELSLVTIPANADATISAIRSYDRKSSAAIGTKRLPVVSIKPGGAGPTPTAPTRSEEATVPKPIADQIRDFVAVRAEKAARMLAITEASADKGETFDDAVQQEFDGLESEIASIDGHLARLRSAEKIAAAIAQPVDGRTAAGGTETRGAALTVPARVARKIEPGIAFARYVMCMINARGNAERALRLAHTYYPEERGLHSVLESPYAGGDLEMLSRAAVPGAAISDSTWAGALVQYQDLANDFINFLRPMTILGKFGTNGIPGLKPAPFNVRVKRQTTGGSAGWVGEGQAKPLTSWSLDLVLLDYAKCASIAVLTQEMARFGSPSAEGLVRDELAAAIAQQLDKDFVDPSNAGSSRVKPAAITHGATNQASTGTTADDARQDVGFAMKHLAANFIPYSQAVWIANSMTTIELYLMRNALGQREFPDLLPDGGMLEGRPVIVSDNDVASGSPLSSNLILCVPQEIYLSDDGNVAIDVSNEASLQMDTSPTNAAASGSPSAPTATELVSMFQTNSLAVRAEREINWLLRRAAACVYITGAAYTA